MGKLVPRRVFECTQTVNVKIYFGNIAKFTHAFYLFVQIHTCSLNSMLHIPFVIEYYEEKHQKAGTKNVQTYKTRILLTTDYTCLYHGKASIVCFRGAEKQCSAA